MSEPTARAVTPDLDAGTELPLLEQAESYRGSDFDQAGDPLHPPRNRAAVWGFVAGWCALGVPVFGLVALFLGQRGLAQISRTGERGRPLAWIGITLGVLAVFFWAVPLVRTLAVIAGI